ncbi:MAG TPA: hypothetical protein VMU60_11325 [Syntrophobacteria bacterium]|nr:hypothetical protein [Syntrophobacteria bacterium]
MGILRYVAGLAFFILGVIGLFLSILEGILFMFSGLAILFPRNRCVEHCINRARNRRPGQIAPMDARKERLRVFSGSQWRCRLLGKEPRE